MTGPKQFQSHEILLRQEHRGMKHNTPILLDKVNNNADRLGRTESV